MPPERPDPGAADAEPRPPDPSGPRAADPYAAIAELYEAEHREFDADLPLYRALAARAGGPLLELGAGTGRLAIPLAEAGCGVVGVDASAAMLAVARRKLRGRRLPVQFVCADLCTFRSPRQFGLVFCALDTLLHLPDRRALTAACRTAFQALRPGGLLALDVVHPLPDLLAMRDGVLRRQSDFRGPSGARVTHVTAWDAHPHPNVIASYHYYDWTTGGTRLHRQTAQFHLRCFQQTEIETALHTAGFSEPERYGTWDLDPLEPASERMIFVAAKGSAASARP